MKEILPYGRTKLKERGWIMMGKCRKGHSIVLDTSYSEISKELRSYIQCECEIENEKNNSAKNRNLKRKSGDLKEKNKD